MTVRALVPMKALERAKSRLADEFSPRERRWLVLGMLAHVVDTLKRTQIVEEIVLLGSAGLPRFAGVRTMIDAGEGLNADLARAVAHLRDTDVLLVLPADLASLAVADVVALHAATVEHDIAIAPDDCGEGTNALGFRAPASIPFAFGNGSRARHAASAPGGHIILEAPGLAFDVDDPADLCRLTSARRAALMRSGAALASG